MKILLLAPPDPDSFWSFRHALPFVSKQAANPPLGLLTVAGMLPSRWDLRLVDMNVSRLTERDLHWADAVMISALLVHRSSVLAVAARCRSAGLKVIAGGPLFLEDSLDEFPDIDTFVVGEAEELMGALVADLQAGRPARLYLARNFPDLALTPPPRWDLIARQPYASMSLQFSRGCPFNCEFCDIVALNGHVPRHKSPAQMIAELESLRRWGWQDSVFFVDDNFIGNRRRAKELLRAVALWRRDTGSSITFATEASVDLAEDPELLQLMTEAGFNKVFLGLETPNAASLKACAKYQNVRCDMAEAVHKIQQAGLEVMGGFIVGFDEDQPDIFERQFEFIQRAGVVTAMVGLLQALPRSRLYQRFKEEGRLLGESLGDNTRACCNFKTRLDLDFLVRKYGELMRNLYEPENYYGRIRAFLSHYRQKGPRARSGGREVQAFFRSLWVMGIVRRGRRPYWSFLFWMLRHHPAQFGLGMTLVVYGHHFRIMSQTL